MQAASSGRVQAMAQMVSGRAGSLGFVSGMAGSLGSMV
jgi:hypothetical protein